MYGWVGNILKIDLSKGDIITEPTEAYVDDYLGGRGLGVRLIYDHYTPGTDALDPGNPLIFNTGPLTGTALPGSGRVDVTALSPMSNLRAKSNFGAYWGPELKFSGYDHVVIQGKAENPCYIWINEGQVEIRDARHLWGKDTFETQQLIQSELGDAEIKVVCIGPAGEKLVRFACLLTETGDAAGRTGMGAVMGSKNLKAVAVRATGNVAIARPEEFLDLSIQINNEIRKHPAYEELSQWGVARGVQMMYQMGFFPVGYFEDVCWEDIVEKYAAPAYVEQNQLKNVGCYCCPNRCMNFLSVPELGKGVTSCEPFSGFTGAVWNLDMDVFWEATLLVNKMGMDCTETSASIGLLMELYHDKIITAEDTDGIAMERGSKEAILTTIRKIAAREGYGELLAQGQMATAQKFGPEAVEKVDLVKGLAPHAYEFRSFKGTGLMQAVGHRGDPLPLRGSLLEVDWHHANDWFQQVAKEQYGDEEAAIPTSYKGKARSAVISEHMERVADNLGICKWLYGLFIFQDVDMAMNVFNLATGKDWELEKILGVSERVRNLERMFDVRQGLRRKDDSLPKKFFKEPLKSGPYKGEVMDEKKFEEMKDEYYEIRGWDKTSGVPSREKLEQLGLNDVAEEVLPNV
ncbi:MAG: aldehyde ferredoxin oxidoreductase family protein [Desulfosarcinaceae bacterium]